MSIQSIILRLLPLLFVAAAAKRTNDTQPAGRNDEDATEEPNFCDDNRRRPNFTPLYCGPKFNYPNADVPSAEVPFLMIPSISNWLGGSVELYFLYQEFQVKITGSQLTYCPEFYRNNMENQDTDVEEDGMLIHGYPHLMGISPEPVPNLEYLVDRSIMHKWLKNFVGLYYRYGKKRGPSEYEHSMSLIARNQSDVTPVGMTEYDFTELYKRDFDIAMTESDLRILVEDPEINLLYVHEDEAKMLILEYSGPFVSFKFYRMQIPKIPQYTDELRRHLGYEVKQAIYFEELPLPFFPIDPDSDRDNLELMKIWTGTVIEFDKQYLIHFNRYVFKDNDKLQIVSHDHYQMHGDDFFGCQKDRAHTVIVSPIQVKGIISVYDPYKVGDSLELSRKTLIFFDFYYLVVDLDLLEIEFNLNAPSLKKRSYALNFENLKTRIKNERRPISIERLSTKYVKHFHYNTVYFCFDPIVEKPISYKPKVKVAEQPDNIEFVESHPNVAGYCPGSILLIKRRFWREGTPSEDCICFLRRHYFILSIDGLYTPPKNTYVKNHRDSIGNIFRGTALDDIKDESFELVFRYLLNHVVFMTTRWLILLDRDDFMFAYTPDHSRPNVLWNKKFDKKSNAKNRWDKFYFFYIRTHNCLWRRCHQGRDLKDRAALSHELRRRIAMNETYDPYHPSKRKNAAPRKGDFTTSVPVHQPLAADHDPTARFDSSRSDSHGTKSQEQGARYDEQMRHKQGL